MPGSHDWGDAPELYGPRHDYREALILRRLLPALPGPEVLNAGAGAGSLTLKLVDAGLRVTSVEASPALCDWVAAALRERGAGDRTRSCAATSSAWPSPARPSTPPSAPRCSSTSTTTRPPWRSWPGSCAPEGSSS